jgi:hypothetical protein
MLNLLIRLAGLALLAAGVESFRLIPAIVHQAYASGPGAGTAAGLAIFAACAIGAFTLLLVAIPLVLAGLFGLLFGAKAATPAGSAKQPPA